MRRFLAVVLCLVIPAALFSADNGYKVSYIRFMKGNTARFAAELHMV